MGEYKVGQLIELNDGRRGRIRYVGSFHLKPGEWIGLELDEPSGKNDGEVKGQRYFQCDDDHGMFLQAAGIAGIIEQPRSAAPPAPKPAATTTGASAAAAKRLSTASNGAAGASARVGARTSLLGRPAGQSASSVSTAAAPRRQSILEASKARQSLNSSSPTPAARTTTTRVATGATKPATRAPLAGAATRSSTASNMTAVTGPAAKRASLAGKTGAAPGVTAARQMRTSTIGATAAGPRPSAAGMGPVKRAAAPATRASTLQQSRNAPAPTRPIPNQKAAAQAVDNDEEDERNEENDNQGESDEPPRPAAVPVRPGRQLSISSAQAPLLVKSPREPGLSQHTSNQISTLSRENEEYQTTIRVMEKQAAESREQLRDKAKVEAERDRFKNIIDKLQAKIQPQVEEISNLKKELKEKNAVLEKSETQLNEFDDVMELATLDREMAEELAETYKAELDALKIKHEELVLEAEILKAENEDLGREMSPEERNSMGFAQLEKSNERLKDALIRLRNMTQDTEAEMKDRIKELEDEVDENAKYKTQYEEASEHLTQAESLAEDLKQRLETAQGSEDMIEELTEKNMELTEQIGELRGSVHYLQELNELNEELITDHEQNVNGMQEEIDYRDSILLETARKSSEQDAVIEELDYSVGRYRDLVKDLNADLEELRASQQITEAEHTELSSRSKAMMDLNMRLQQSATKTQVKIIDNELKRLEAQESSDKLVIVQRFLPDSYLQHKDSTAAFLSFKRIAFKASMLHGFVKERANKDTVVGHEEDVFAACDMLNKFVWVSTTCQRFVQFVVASPLDTWQRMGSTTYDLEPVERTLNGWIDALKRDEFRESQSVSELQRTMSVLEHLGERFFGESLIDYAEQVNLSAVMMQSQLDGAVSALSQIKSIAKARVTLPTDADEDDEQEIESFNAKADSLIAQARSVLVVAQKSQQQLEELTARSLTLEPNTQASVESTISLVDSFATACRAAGSKVVAAINDDTRTESLSYEHIARAVSVDDGSPFSTLSSQLNTVSNAIQAFSNLTTTLSSTVEFDVPPPVDNLNAQTTPWAQLSAHMRAESAATADRDAEVARLNDTLSERSTALAMKDKRISELGVTIEVLQKRADDGAKATTRARDFESQLDDTLKKREALEEQVMKKEEEIRQLKAERENWKAAGVAAGGVGTDGNAVPFDEAKMARVMEDMAEGGYIPAKAAQELEILRAELEATRSVVRQLRQAATDASFQAAQSDGILEPLNPEQPMDVQREQVLAGEQEAKAVLKELRRIVNTESDRTVRIKSMQRGERLKWRPAHERLAWQVGAKREEWENWCEWVADLAKQERRQSERQDKIAEQALRREQEQKEVQQPQVLARMRLRSRQMRAGKDLLPAGEIKIVDPTEWNRLGTQLGLSY